MTLPGVPEPVDFDRFQQNTINEGYDEREWSARRWAIAPSGEPIEFGRLPADAITATGLPDWPIRIRNGLHFTFESGFGIRHIITQRGLSLAEAGFRSVQDFIGYTLEEIVQLYESERRGRDRRMVVRLREPFDLKRSVIVIEADAREQSYAIITGYLKDYNSRINEKLIWERREARPESPE